MNSIKLCVTSRGNLKAKYSTAKLKQLDAAMQKWIAADRKRGIHTIYVALDNAAAMAKYGVPAIAGAVTAVRAKRAIDKLWKKLQPDYLVILGAQDIIPYFEVPNPSRNDDDTDAVVPTDNPYASDRAFTTADHASYLAPSRVCGRIPDMLGNGDPGWLTRYLARAAAYKPQQAGFFAKPYTICCKEWQRAGKKSVAHFGADPTKLLISPPADDHSAQAHLKATLHMIKCHGAELDPRFFGQAGEKFPIALHSKTLGKKLSKHTVAAAMCCYGAQVYSPEDPATAQKGAWPLASTYLRNGALGFAGSTMIAWVGDSEMMCADWIVAGFLKAVLGGASLGRAFLDAKLGYFQWLQQQGQTPDVADEKTMLEFVLLGDPALHPVIANAVPGATNRKVAAAMFASPATANERRQRRVVRARLATNICRELPTRSGYHAPPLDKLRRLTKQAARLTDTENGQVKLTGAPSIAQKITHGTNKAGSKRIAAGMHVTATVDTYQYYWSDRVDKNGIKRIRLVKMETDANGMLLRSRVLHSS